MVVRKGASEYAFHRGTTHLGAPQTAEPNQDARLDFEQPGKAEQSLDANLKVLNQSNTLKQLQRLQDRYQAAPAEQAPGAAAGEFR